MCVRSITLRRVLCRTARKNNYINFISARADMFANDEAKLSEISKKFQILLKVFLSRKLC